MKFAKEKKCTQKKKMKNEKEKQQTLTYTYTHTQNLCENLRCTDRKDDSNPN